MNYRPRCTAGTSDRCRWTRGAPPLPPVANLTFNGRRHGAGYVRHAVRAHAIDVGEGRPVLRGGVAPVYGRRGGWRLRGGGGRSDARDAGRRSTTACRQTESHRGHHRDRQNRPSRPNRASPMTAPTGAISAVRALLIRFHVQRLPMLEAVLSEAVLSTVPRNQRSHPGHNCDRVRLPTGHPQRPTGMRASHLPLTRLAVPCRHTRSRTNSADPVLLPPVRPQCAAAPRAATRWRPRRAGNIAPLVTGQKGRTNASDTG